MEMPGPDHSALRNLPSIDQLLQTQVVTNWVEKYGRPLALQALRTTLDEIRRDSPRISSLPGQDEILHLAEKKLEIWTAPSLVSLINATGVVLHTNLGRAPLSQAAITAMQDVSQGYSNLEYDLKKGERGSRLLHAEELLKRLTGVEAALVVNNNAAAVLLVLSALAKRRAVIIARSQLVEIGGGFRVPDVMKQSGARLVEIGATNRVHLSDYQLAIQEENPALVLRAHRSNFRLVGFTSEPELSEIAQAAHQAGLVVVDDLGSGALIDTARFGLGHEPTVAESLASGADLVCFSGDKLLGGPQSGIIIGRTDLIARLKKHPLARAIRTDKVCLAALSATLTHYLKDEAEQQIPIWRMIAASREALESRALAWKTALGQGELVSTLSTVGGGSLPDEALPTTALALNVAHPNSFLEKLRRSQPPIVARLEDGRVIFDPRTILPEQDEILLQLLKGIL